MLGLLLAGCGGGAAATGAAGDGDRGPRRQHRLERPDAGTVNGQSLPAQEIAPGEVQLWHLANIGADIWHDLELEGSTFTVVGEDGNPKWRVSDADHLVLPPGKRWRSSSPDRGRATPPSPPGGTSRATTPIRRPIA